MSQPSASEVRVGDLLYIEPFSDAWHTPAGQYFIGEVVDVKRAYAYEPKDRWFVKVVMSAWERNRSNQRWWGPDEYCWKEVHIIGRE